MYCINCRKFSPPGRSCSCCVSLTSDIPINDPQNVYFIRRPYIFGVVPMIESFAPEGYEDEQGFHFGKKGA